MSGSFAEKQKRERQVAIFCWYEWLWVCEYKYIKKKERKKNFAMNLPILGSHHELLFKVDDNFRKYINPFNSHNEITPQEHF